jgi:hypothetical protein
MQQPKSALSGAAMRVRTPSIQQVQEAMVDGKF